MPKYIRYQVSNCLTDDFLEPWGQCDQSGQMFPRSQLVRQMIQAGNDVTWSGFWVHRAYIDPLNEQLKTPPTQDDPKPVPYPRDNLGRTRTSDADPFPNEPIYGQAQGGSFQYPPAFSNNQK
jgi:hypothetical protein